MSTLGDVFGHPKETRDFSADRDFILPKCYIGIEIEAEGLQGPPPELSYWKVTNDGSLRNGGVEFISNKVFGGDIKNALKEISPVIKDLSFSKRTSIHIHLDARDMCINDLVRLLIIYYIYEDAIFTRLVADHRDGNNHCRRLIGSSVEDSITNLFLSKPESVPERPFATWFKYLALNIKPVRSQGSIEFRHLEGTSDIKKIFDWINIIFSIKKYATSYNESTQSLIDRVCYNPEELTNNIFCGKYLLYEESMFSGMVEGARAAQALFFYEGASIDCYEHLFLGKKKNPEERIMPPTIEPEVPPESNTAHFEDVVLVLRDMIDRADVQRERGRVQITPTTWAVNPEDHDDVDGF